MVFVKEAPDKKSASIGCLREGQRLKCKLKMAQGSDGHAWVELALDQLRRVEGAATHQWQKPEMSRRGGFCLIDGSHLGLGTLLRGPLPPLTRMEEDLWRAAEDEQITTLNKQRIADLREFKSKQEVLARNKRKDDKTRRQLDAMERWKADADMDESSESAQRTRSGVVVYRAMHDVLFKKTAGGNVTQQPCQRGQCVFTTGVEWNGPQGGLWVQSARKAREYFLIEGPGFGVQGPLMLSEPATLDHIRVSLFYVSSTAGDFRIFDGFIQEDTTVKSLKHEIAT